MTALPVSLSGLAEQEPRAAHVANQGIRGALLPGPFHSFLAPSSSRLCPLLLSLFLSSLLLAVTLVANGSAQQPSSMPLRPVSAGRRVEERHWQPVARTHLPHPQGRAGTCRTRVLAGVLECVCWCSGVLNMT